MANPNYELLGALHLTRVLRVIQDVRETPQPLRYLRKTPIVPALPEEITARFLGRAVIADIIADDSAARVYSFGRFQTETASIPNSKIGINLTQAQIKQLTSLFAMGGPAVTDADSPLTRFFNQMATALRLGLDQRAESLLVGAAIDNFAYDGLGIKLSGVTFGTWSDLKATTSPTWDSASTADGVNDVLQLKYTARTRYGKEYDRMVIPFPAFNYLRNQTSFQNRARVYYSINPNVTAGSLPVMSNEWAMQLAIPLMELKEIVFYDARYWYQDTAGNVISARYQPANMVVLESSEDDNRADVMDLANTVVTESQVAALMPTSMIGNLPPGEYGPISYATPTNVNMNPPGITEWGVACRWPRKWDPAATASLNVGNFGDTVSVGVPFPIPNFQ